MILAMMELNGAGMLFIPFALATFAFWVWMLVESAKHKQFVWLVVIALTNVFGAVVYFLLGRGSQPVALSSNERAA
jgi:hypothetical protein